MELIQVLPEGSNVETNESGNELTIRLPRQKIGIWHLATIVTGYFTYSFLWSAYNLLSVPIIALGFLSLLFATMLSAVLYTFINTQLRVETYTVSPQSIKIVHQGIFKKEFQLKQMDISSIERKRGRTRSKYGVYKTTKLYGELRTNDNHSILIFRNGTEAEIEWFVKTLKQILKK